MLQPRRGGCTDLLTDEFRHTLVGSFGDRLRPHGIQTGVKDLDRRALQAIATTVASIENVDGGDVLYAAKVDDEPRIFFLVRVRNRTLIEVLLGITVDRFRSLAFGIRRGLPSGCFLL